LPLAPRQGIHPAGLQTGQVDLRQRGAGQLCIRLAFPVPAAQVGMASGQGGFENRGGKGVAPLLPEPGPAERGSPRRESGRRWSGIARSPT
jgi:hypothetical protein